MADSWTVTAVDRDLVSINVTIGAAVIPFKVSVAELGAIADLTAAVNKIRPLVRDFYNGYVARNTVPAKFAAGVGYSEPFA